MPLATWIRSVCKGSADQQPVGHGFGGDDHELHYFNSKKQGEIDLRNKDIEDGFNMGDQRSILTLESQAYKIAQYIGQYIISLGGLDVVTFAGGVGENGIDARIRICKYLEPFGVKLDLDKIKNRLKDFA